MSELKESTVPGSVYEHYKGEKYIYICEATDHLTWMVNVVYMDKNGKLWCRSIHDFFGTVKVNSEYVPEFRYTGQILSI